MNKYIEFSKEVKEAISNNLPIVALETTILSHGMPYPTNLEVAHKCEEIIRSNGCVPATIAVIEGKIKIGLTEDELEFMAKSKDILKLSRRDLPHCIALKLNGATTVAATMIIAQMANIRFFATGGIGGVHRDVEHTLDISADLEELAKTNVNVICAGAKSILDLDKTMEYLETKGVLVVGYKTSELSAFFTNKSGIEVPLRIDDVDDMVSIIKTQEELGYNQGILITNPISDKYSLPKDKIDKAIEEVLIKMKELNITGKKVTPFLLSEINNITKGISLEANQHLVYSNCDLASKLAYKYNQLKKAI